MKTTSHRVTDLTLVGAAQRWSAATMKKLLLTATILLTALCAAVGLPIVVDEAHAQTTATPSNCFGSWASRCLVDSDLPDRNGPSRYWEHVERNGWITGSAPMSNDNNTNWALWRLNPSRGGTHRVACYISDEFGIADARYRVYVNGDLKSLRVVDQSNYSDKRVAVGSVYVPSGRSAVEVRLGDRSTDRAGIEIFAGRCELLLGGGATAGTDLLWLQRFRNGTNRTFVPRPTPSSQSTVSPTRPTPRPQATPVPRPTARPAPVSTAPEIRRSRVFRDASEDASCKRITNEPTAWGATVELTYFDGDGKIGHNVPITFNLGTNNNVATKREVWVNRDGNGRSGTLRFTRCFWGNVDSFHIRELVVTDADGMNNYPPVNLNFG